MNHLFRSLRHRNFLLFFVGQGISLLGTWMTQVACLWLVYRLSHSAFLLGLVGFASNLPAFFFSPFAGVWIDRVNQHRLLKITQTLSMLNTFALAFLTLAHRITMLEVILLSLIQGFILTIDLPVRQAFLVHMVHDKRDFGNAIALNSFIVNVARFVGPIAAGAVVVLYGEGMCFLLDAISFIAVLVSLFLMSVKIIPKAKTSHSVLQDIGEGVRYVVGFIPIRNVLLLLMVLSFVGLPQGTLLPIFAAEIFKGDAHALGALMAASGFGAILGAVFLASKKNVLGLGRISAAAGCVFGAALSVFSFAHFWYLALALQAIMGFSMLLIIAASNTFLQAVVDENKRGRLMSLYTFSFLGIFPFGNLLVGWLAKHFGAPTTLFFLMGSSALPARSYLPIICRHSANTFDRFMSKKVFLRLIPPHEKRT